MYKIDGRHIEIWRSGVSSQMITALSFTVESPTARRTLPEQDHSLSEMRVLAGQRFSSVAPLKWKRWFLQGKFVQHLKGLLKHDSLV